MLGALPSPNTRHPSSQSTACTTCGTWITAIAAQAGAPPSAAIAVRCHPLATSYAHCPLQCMVAPICFRITIYAFEQLCSYVGSALLPNLQELSKLPNLFWEWLFEIKENTTEQTLPQRPIIASTVLWKLHLIV